MFERVSARTKYFESNATLTRPPSRESPAPTDDYRRTPIPLLHHFAVYIFFGAPISLPTVIFSLPDHASPRHEIGFSFTERERSATTLFALPLTFSAILDFAIFPAYLPIPAASYCLPPTTDSVTGPQRVRAPFITQWLLHDRQPSHCRRWLSR